MCFVSDSIRLNGEHQIASHFRKSAAVIGEQLNLS